MANVGEDELLRAGTPAVDVSDGNDTTAPNVVDVMTTVDEDVLSHESDVDVTVQSPSPVENLIEPASQGVQFPSVPLP
jgi:hypothetical protein